MSERLDDCTAVIYAALDQVSSLFDLHLEKGPATPLVGQDSGLDSLAFVNFVVAVEEMCAQRFGVQISLLDGETAANESVQFTCVGDLAHLLTTQIGRAVSVR
jgi:acyl carrier protein